MISSNYHGPPMTHEQCCRVLEALCEGYVLAMLAEMDAEPTGTFPCCIKCGGFRTRNAPLTPAQAESIEDTLEHGHPVSGLQRKHLADILEHHGYVAPIEASDAFHGADPEATRNYEAQIHVRSAGEIADSAGGTTIELACYQCAMKRRGPDAGAKVVICCTIPGTFRGAVLQSPGHDNPERRGRLDDPVVDARPYGECGCGPEEGP